MHRILFQIGDYPIYTYGVMMAVGIIAAVTVTWLLARQAGRYQDEVIDFALWAVIAGIIGARLSYVIPRWDFYGDNPLSLFAIWQGGLTIQGGLIGGLIAAVIYTRIKGINFWAFGDLFAPGLVLGQAMGRIGCYFNGCSFGIPTGGGWGLVFPDGTDAFARFGSQPLYPTQLFELTWDIGIFALLLFLWKRRKLDGFIFLLYGALWSIGTALIRFIRGDLAVNVSGLTGGQVVGFAVALAAMGLMFYLYRRQSPAGPVLAGDHASPKTARRNVSSGKSGRKASPAKALSDKVSSDKTSPASAQTSSPKSSSKKTAAAEAGGNTPSGSSPRGSSSSSRASKGSPKGKR